LLKLLIGIWKIKQIETIKMEFGKKHYITENQNKLFRGGFLIRNYENAYSFLSRILFLLVEIIILQLKINI